MKVSKIFGAVLLAGMSLLTMAADLTFDLKINRGVAKDYNPENKKKNIAVFVIDCSGSMAAPYDPSGKGQFYYGPDGPGPRKAKWTRVQKLCEELLPEQIMNLPMDETHVFLYSSYDGSGPFPARRSVTFKTAQDKVAFLKQLKLAIYTRVAKNGATPYFDTMRMVLCEIKDKWLDDRNVNLWLFDYTDGENATNGFYPETFIFNAHQKNQSQKNAAADDFKKSLYNKWLDRIKNDKKRLFYNETNIGTADERKGFNQTPQYQVIFYCQKSDLKNPKDAPKQTVRLSADFGVKPEIWNLLQNQPCTLKIQFDNGQVQSRQVVISASKKQPITLEVPDGAAKVTVTFDYSGIKSNRKFKLLPETGMITESIKFPAADPTKVGIEAVTVNDRLYDGKTVTVRKGKVHFTAEGTAKNYTWRFFEGKTPVTKKSADGESVPYEFKKTGIYSFEVVADGNPKSKRTGTIKVVDIGLKIKDQGDKNSFTDEWENRLEATVDDGQLEPQSLTWSVIGPYTGKKEEVPPMGEGEPLPNHPLKCRYFFRTPGKYLIRVTAKYAELPDETFEAPPKTWIVYEKAAIAFTKDTPADGQGFEFGKEITLGIETTKGKIDPESIVWKKDGQEYDGRGPKIAYTQSVVQGQKQVPVVFRVEAKDAVLKKPVPPLERTYTFGCSHTKPKVEVVTKDKSKFTGRFGLYEEADFMVSPGTGYKDIVWIFGDDPKKEGKKPAAGTQSVHYTAEKAGKGFTHVMTCRCAKCGEIFEVKLTTETISKEAKPVLKLNPEKASYSKGDSFTPSDDGEGDYFQSRLLMKRGNGQWVPVDKKHGHVTDYQNLDKRKAGASINIGEGDQFGVTGLNQRADFAFKLQALDKAGKPIGESAVRTVRVRNHWIDGGILAIIIAFFIALTCLMKKFLFGNQPCGWTLFYMARKDLVQDNPKDKNRFLDQLKVTANLTVGEYWTVWTLSDTKQATIPIGELMAGSAGSDETLTIDSDGKISYQGGFRAVPNYSLPVDNPRQVSKIFEPKNKNGKQKQYLYFLLDKNESDTHYEKWFYILCFFSLAVAGAAAYWLFMC